MNGLEESEAEQMRDLFWTRNYILTATIVGLLLVLIYSICSVSTGGEFCRLFGTIALIASAALLLGTLTGFLFGIPRTLQDGYSASSTPTGHEESREPNDLAAKYAVNTNLEQISDWLTKILVGVGLTELRRAPELFGRLSVHLVEQSGISPKLFTPSIALATVIFYSITGFLAGYLLTRLFLAGAFSRADVFRKKAAEKVDKLENLDLPLKDLGQGEAEILRRVIVAGRDQKSYVLGEGFARGSATHQDLRSLKDRSLIRPKEGGRWEVGKTVEFTPIAIAIIDRIEAAIGGLDP